MAATARAGRPAAPAMSARPIRALNLARRRQCRASAWLGHFRGFGGRFRVVRSREIPRGPKRVLMDGHEALADLKQISVQIEAAVIADHGGAVLACSPDDGPTGELLCRLAREIWEAADASRRDLGRDALTQVELSTAQGSVFVVRDERPRPACDDGARSHGRAGVLRPQVGAARARRPARANAGADRRLAGRRRHERGGAGRWRGVGGGWSGR